MTNQNSGNDIFRGGFNLDDYEKFSIKGFRDIRQVSETGSPDRFFGVPFIGDSLKHLGILHGDLLIVKITQDFNENSLFVWDTPNGRTAKYAYNNFGEIVLHNKGNWKQSWDSGKVNLLGVVVRVERDLKVV